MSEEAGQLAQAAVRSARRRPVNNSYLTHRLIRANRAAMQIGLRQISSEAVEWFREACRDDGPERLSRSAMAREFCRIEKWRDASGEPCRASAQKLLPKLALSLGVSLPEPGSRPGGSHRRPETDFPDKALACGLAALGEVSVEPVPEGERRSWESMVESHHPLGWRRAPGGQKRYWIHSSRCGILGGIGFAAAGCQLAPRDQFIGWSTDARLANIGLVVCNQRFLILPGVRVRGLASRSLRLAAARVAGDWEAKYGSRPALAYSFTGSGQSGLSYRAAGWKLAAEATSGRRSGAPREVWLKPLDEGWRERLCREPRRSLGHAPTPLEGAWEDREYARSFHPDGRVRRRIAKMGMAWLERPGEELPKIFPGKAERQAAYRLLSNDRVAMEHVLNSHFEATAERCRLEKLVLAAQDAAKLNYDGLDATSGIDGILAHCSVAINAAGRPLGLLGFDASFGRAEEMNSVRWVAGLDRASELSAACPDTRVVAACDRDFWALLARARDAGAALLVRAGRSAKRRVKLPDGKTEDLWKRMEDAPSLGARNLEVPERGARQQRKMRTARLTVRCEAVELVPPKKVGGEAIRMVAVSAREDTPPRSILRTNKGGPLHWLLLTTEGGPDAETAAAALRLYELRRQFECFFFALKVGTRIKDRRLDKAEELRKCLAFDAITTFRVWDLSLRAREKPDDPAHRRVPIE